MGVFTDIVNDSLRAELSPDGFFLMGRSRWVSDTNGPIRRIFEFKLLKGATYSARWGFSLDFVPVLRNGRLQQKPTSKSAEFDLCIDPIDECGVPPDWCSLADLGRYDATAIKDIIRVATDATRAARTDFARVVSVGDLTAAFHRRAQMSFRRFSLENYAQTHLAWGLALLATAKTAEGEAHVTLFCEQHDIDRDDPVLRKAEADASRYAASSPS
jgi:hypothetical protein